MPLHHRGGFYTFGMWNICLKKFGMWNISSKNLGMWNIEKFRNVNFQEMKKNFLEKICLKSTKYEEISSVKACK